MKLSPVVALLLLTYMNVINFVDRGIVAGAGLKIKGCVSDVAECGPVHDVKKCDNDPDVVPCTACRVCASTCEGKTVRQTGLGISEFLLGIIQSLFMLGYMLGSFVFSHMVHGRRLYKLLGSGMGLWTLAVLGSGLSGKLTGDNRQLAVVLLGVSRALSGVGEAALATIALPHLDDVVPASSKGKYLAAYLCAMPFGTALGFAWAGAVSEKLSWEWAYMLEAPFMLPVVAFLYFAPLEAKLKESPVSPNAETPLLAAANAGDDAAPPSLLSDVLTCLRQPVFTLTAFGLAAYTFSTSGLAFFTPMFLQSYRPCDPAWQFSEAQADVLFGVLVSSAGLVGVVAGGWLYDESVRVFTGNDCVRALKLCLVEVGAASALFVFAGAVTNVAGFFVLVWLACVLCFLTMTPCNLVLLDAVPVRLRSLSMALSLVVGHLFGDVPSPSLIGLVADRSGALAAYYVAGLGTPVSFALWALAAVYAARRTRPLV